MLQLPRCDQYFASNAVFPTSRIHSTLAVAAVVAFGYLTRVRVNRLNPVRVGPKIGETSSPGQRLVSRRPARSVFKYGKHRRA
jgi:hypothetical protein